MATASHENVSAGRKIWTNWRENPTPQSPSPNNVGFPTSKVNSGMDFHERH